MTAKSTYSGHIAYGCYYGLARRKKETIVIAAVIPSEAMTLDYRHSLGALFFMSC